MEGVPPGYEHVISSPAEARRAVRANIENGADVIKTWLGLTAEELAAVVEEAHRNSIRSMKIRIVVSSMTASG
ncbi:MAG: hypothetical protein RQ826_05930 [Xanthomonadales bacterium]|nr:hypothetical protein [Xanthomonadales bacterium]